MMVELVTKGTCQMVHQEGLEAPYVIGKFSEVSEKDLDCGSAPVTPWADIPRSGAVRVISRIVCYDDRLEPSQHFGGKMFHQLQDNFVTRRVSRLFPSIDNLEPHCQVSR